MKSSVPSEKEKQDQQPVVISPKWNKKSLMIIGAVVGGLLVLSLLGAGGYVLYKNWSENNQAKEGNQSGQTKEEGQSSQNGEEYQIEKIEGDPVILSYVDSTGKVIEKDLSSNEIVTEFQLPSCESDENLDYRYYGTKASLGDGEEVYYQLCEGGVDFFTTSKLISSVKYAELKLDREGSFPVFVYRDGVVAYGSDESSFLFNLGSKSLKEYPHNFIYETESSNPDSPDGYIVKKDPVGDELRISLRTLSFSKDGKKMFVYEAAQAGYGSSMVFSLDIVTGKYSLLNSYDIFNAGLAVTNPHTITTLGKTYTLQSDPAKKETYLNAIDISNDKKEAAVVLSGVFYAEGPADLYSSLSNISDDGKVLFVDSFEFCYEDGSPCSKEKNKLAVIFVEGKKIIEFTKPKIISVSYSFVSYFGDSTYVFMEDFDQEINPEVPKEKYSLFKLDLKKEKLQEVYTFDEKVFVLDVKSK